MGEEEEGEKATKGEDQKEEEEQMEKEEEEQEEVAGKRCSFSVPPLRHRHRRLHRISHLTKDTH